MRWIASWCVGGGRDDESFALPLSYPGVSRTYEWRDFEFTTTDWLIG